MNKSKFPPILGVVLLIIGLIVPLIRGFGIGFAFIIYLAMSVILLMIYPVFIPRIMPHFAIGIVRTKFIYALIYGVVLAIDLKMNPLTNQAFILIESLLFWLSPWMVICYFLASFREGELIRGADWTRSSASSSNLSITMVGLLLGFTFYSALAPVTVGWFRSLGGETDKAITALHTTLWEHPNDIEAKRLLEALENKKNAHLKPATP